MDLSILIPSRNEEFLARTVEDLFANIEGDTEIIVVLDGALADPVLPIHKRLTVVYLQESIGQRASMNLACKLSNAKYVAKVDAHCAFDKGFDVKMMEKMEDDITMVPVMRNLHVFDWVCENCGMRVYQGPEPKECRNETCTFDEQKFKKDIVWIPKTNPQSSAYRFTNKLQFKYFPELRAIQPKEGLAETMSLQGSFFMCTREKYWDLKLCDESWGSWGQQGSEVALKTWLSGGRVLCNMDTWYAHLFRTQKGFDHPFPIGNSQHNARKICRDIFLNDKWDKAIHPLSWLLEKFWKQLKQVSDNVDMWTDNDLVALGVKLPPSKGILYYTDNQCPVKIAKRCQKQLKSIGLPITSVSLKPMDFGHNIHYEGNRSHETMFKQILIGLEAMTEEIVFFCETDVLYHPSHFDFTPKKDTFHYNDNVWFYRLKDGHCLHYDAQQLSGLCAYRKPLIKHFKERLELIEKEGFSRKMGFEPMTHNRIKWNHKYKCESWQSESPNVDIRHGGNATGSKWKKEDFRNQKFTKGWTEAERVPGWDGLGKSKVKE